MMLPLPIRPIVPAVDEDPPACSIHGSMTRRPLDVQTEEQRWCGEWWDCSRCSNTVLVMSAEVAALYRQRRKAAPQKP